MAICSLLYNIFWSISFQRDYHHLLETNHKLVEFVKQISKNQGNEDQIALVRKLADGILFNLDLIESNVHSKSLSNEIVTDGVKVMVS